MKVYLVERNYDNGESYEDAYDSTVIETVCLTEEKAVEYINGLSVEKLNCYADNWTEGNPYEYENASTARMFYNEPRYEGSDYETLWYTIREMEVTE